MKRFLSLRCFSVKHRHPSTRHSTPRIHTHTSSSTRYITLAAAACTSFIAAYTTYTLLSFSSLHSTLSSPLHSKPHTVYALDSSSESDTDDVNERNYQSHTRSDTSSGNADTHTGRRC